MSDGEPSIKTRSSYREAVRTQHGALEYGSYLHVNERQKIRHYCARFTEKLEEEEKERQMAIFYFAWYARKLRYYGDIIHSFYWKSVVEHDGGV